MNRVMIIGNVGKDPEFKTFQSGDEICNLSVATSERWKDKSTGETKEKTTWHSVVVSNPALVKLVKVAVQKGTKLFVEGSLEQRTYEKNGETRYVTEIGVRPFNGGIEICAGGKPRAEPSAAIGARPAPSPIDDEIQF